MPATAIEGPEGPVIEREADQLADGIRRVLAEHDAATDGRSYLLRVQARSRQRAFLYALRRHEDLSDVHTHVRQDLAGRWRVYATRLQVYPAPIPQPSGNGSHRTSRRRQAASTASG